MERKNSNGLKVPFGSKAARLYAPGDIAESGLACGCTCPGCGTQLVIRQGTKRRHFAHYRCPASQSCVESAIHKAAIQVLLEAKQLRVPEKKMVASITTKDGFFHSGEQIQADARSIRFENVAAEVNMAIDEIGLVRPDVVGYRNGRQLLVEMCFRHAVDDEKREKLRQLGFPVIEINLSDLDAEAGFDAVRLRVIDDLVNKEWLVYPGDEVAQQALRERLVHEGEEIDAKNRREKAAVMQLHQESERKRQEYERRTQAGHREFRNLASAEKEEKLRRELGISNVWPRYLRLRNTENQAIDALPHLWQASVFQQFVYGRKRYDFTFELVQALNWVKCRFDMGDDGKKDAHEAVRKFLAYLGGCGFIELHHNPYAASFYKVLHNRLEPPERQNHQPSRSQRQNSSLQHANHPAYQPAVSTHRNAAIGSDWQWLPDWPSKEEAMRVATKWICRSQPHYVAIVNRLYGSEIRPTEPRNFAEEMAVNGMPAREILTFLAEAKLAY